MSQLRNNRFDDGYGDLEPEEEEAINAAFEQAVFHRSCYLAGPMAGIEDLNFPAFHQAEVDLTSRGWKVYSPAQADDNDETQGLGYYIARDMPYVLIRSAPAAWSESTTRRAAAGGTSR